MNGRWAIRPSEELNDYQVYNERLRRNPVLTAFNAFSVKDRIILNLLFEDDNWIYPVLFAELNPAEGRLIVPSNALPLVADEVLDTVQLNLLHDERKLGQHSTLFLVKPDSVIAQLLQRIRNWQRTPYVGLTDIRTQTRSYLLYKQIAEALQGEARTVLDLGCGSGYGSALLARAGLHVTAMDIDNLPITYAERLYTGNRITFVCQPLEELLQRKEKFDAVVASEVLEHNEDHDSFLEKVATMTRVGGWAAISVPSWVHHGVDLNSDHRTNWTFSKANRVLQKFFRIRGKYAIRYAEDPQQYSISLIDSELPNAEDFLLIGENRPSLPGFNPGPSSVLLVCHNIPPYEYTGTPIVTWRYAQGLQSLGYRVAVLVPNLPKASAEVVLEENDGVSIYRVPPLNFASASLEALSNTDRQKLQHLAQVFNHLRPDIVHIIDYVFLPPQILQMAADYGATVIRHICNTEELCLRGSPVIPSARKVCDGPSSPSACALCVLDSDGAANDIFFARQVSQLAGQIAGWQEYVRYAYRKLVDTVVFTNTSFADYFLKYVPFPEKKIHIVPHGLSSSIPPGSRQKEKGRVTIGFLGEIAFLKGIDLIRKAFQSLPKSRVELLVFGKSRDQSLLAGLRDLPCARYMGEYTPPDLDSILQDIDVGVVPSYFETYSQVTREFIAHGIPVVASRFFGSEIIRDGENGLLIEIGDADELRKKVLAVINDPDLLSRLKAGARATKIPTIYEEIDAVHRIYQEAYKYKFSTRNKMGGMPGLRNQRLASIVIPVHNNWEYTRRCLLSLEAAGYRDRAEVIVVDNASSDATPSGLKTEFPWVKSLRNEQNLGFAVACNGGANVAEGKYLVFLSNDTEVRKGWLESLIAAYEGEKGAGVVGSKLLYPDGSLQHAGVEIIYPGHFFPIDARHIRYRQPDSPDTRREVDAVTGASMLVPADVFYELGGFEEVYQNGYEDIDFCLKARAGGYRIIYEPSSQAIHYESKTPGCFDSELKNINIFHRRWLPWVLEHCRKASPPQELQSQNRPPVSIIIVTYNSLPTIATCLESVLATTISADEIIVVDNNSRDETSYYIECLNNALVGRQIRLRQETQNTGYAGAAAKGAQLARHDFLIFLNPDTTVFSGWIEGLLTPLLGDNPKMAASGPVSNYAAGLQNITKYIGGRDDLEKDPVYLAKTALERYGGKVVPSNLLIGFCLAVRKQAYEEIGGIDNSLFLGNDDLDLSWRLMKAGYQQVVVPSVFVFHRGQESFATEPKVKTKYLVQQSTNQLYEKLYASYNGHVPDGKSLWGIEWFSPQKELISVIMPVYKGASLTRLALTTLVQATKPPFEVIIINNGSDPETTRALARMAKELPATIRVLSNEQNLGYPRAVNQGLAEANGDYLVVMNNDVLVTPFWASRLIAAFAVDPALGIVGPRTNYAAGIQAVTGCNYTEESLAEWAQKWYLGEAGTLRAVNRLIGFLWMMKREVVERIGGFDPLFGIGNYEDDDYCIRAQLAGFKLALADDVFVHHYGSQSFKKKPDSYQMLLDVNRMLFAGKWDVDFFNNGYQMEPILARGCASFDQGDLYIPLGFNDVFSPSLEPLDIGCSLANCLMCVPDPSDIHQTWLDLVKRYLQTYKPGSGVALMIRVEPTTKEWFLRVVSSIEEMARKEGLDLERDDLIIEGRRVPSSHRGRVYRAASFFIPLPGVRREPLIQEAYSCGLTIVEPEKLGVNALGPGIGRVMVR